MFIGGQIAKFRKEKRMTQEQLGGAVGVTNRTVSKWESGTTSPGVDLIPSIASALGVSTDRLFGIVTQDIPEDSSGGIRIAVQGALSQVLPGALEEALDDLLPEYLNSIQPKDGYSLLVLSRDGLTVVPFCGKASVGYHKFSEKWSICISSPGGNVNLEGYESEKEASDDLKKIFTSFSNKLARIEL